jgi:hypothetical protein
VSVSALSFALTHLICGPESCKGPAEFGGLRVILVSTMSTFQLKVRAATLDAGIRALKPSYQTFFEPLDTLYWQYKPSAEARTSTVSILRDLSFQRLTFLAGAAKSL